MAQVVKLEIEESGYIFTFIPKPRENSDSFVPVLVAVVDQKANIHDARKDIPKVIKHRAFSLAAVIFNKFKDF